MILNYVLAVLDRDRAGDFAKLCADENLSFALILMAHGAATDEMLDIYGIAKTRKVLIMVAADEEATWRLKRAARRRLSIDVPGNGIMMIVPIKSVGGRSSMAKLTTSQALDQGIPPLDFPYELIVAIAERGYADEVMGAALTAGASGGTILHATNAGVGEGKFLGLNLGSEKDMVLIAARADQKAAIMKAIIDQSGPATDAQAVTFSLPVSEVAGFRRIDTVDT